MNLVSDKDANSNESGERDHAFFCSQCCNFGKPNKWVNLAEKCVGLSRSRLGRGVP